MKLITKKWLKNHEACGEGHEWYLKQGETSAAILVERLIKDEHHDWATWTMTRLFTHKQNIAYAIFAAEQVISNYEKEYPDDDRPRKAIEAAKKVLEHDTKKNKGAAYSAADSAARSASSAARSADSAAYSAYSAAYSAYSAAYSAADSAAYSAYSAAYSAYSAADSAAYSAYSAYSAAYSAARSASSASSAMKKTICLYGLGLLKEGKC